MKSTWLNSKRVFLNILGLVFLAYVPREVKLEAPWVQAIYIGSAVFMILSTVMGISWSEKGLGVIREVTTDALRIKRPKEEVSRPALPGKDKPGDGQGVGPSEQGAPPA